MAVCEKCGSENVKFERESTGTISGTRSSRTSTGNSSRIGRTGFSSRDSSSTRISQSIRGHRTVGICNDCGNTWVVQDDIQDAVNASMKKCNKTVALVLCIFLGVLGGHKFYEGKIGMGFLYMFTGGLLGIGWIVDIIRIAAKPREYYV